MSPGVRSVPQSAGTSKPLRLHGHEIRIDTFRARFEEELLDDHLGHRVLALAEVVVSDPPLGVRDVERRPEVVREGLPDPVVAVDRDRVLDAEGREAAQSRTTSTVFPGRCLREAPLS